MGNERGMKVRIRTLRWTYAPPPPPAPSPARQVAHASFEDVLSAAQAAWRDVATSIAVVDAGAAYAPADATALLTIFYSSLYRASKFPRAAWETEAGTGNTVHWSPYTGRVEQGVFSTDVGFWDAYRTTPSLLSLWRPAQVRRGEEGGARRRALRRF
jgi:putative alpha-1,2-mannosidase